MTHATDSDSTEEEDKIISRFSEHLMSLRMRKTPERFAILRRAMKIKGHFSGADLYSKLENDGYHVSRMTVYSTLELLCECGLVNRHMLDTKSARYEMALGSHCHLICMACAKVEEIATPDFELAMNGLDYHGFSPSYFSTSVYGLCRECARRRHNPAKSDC